MSTTESVVVESQDDHVVIWLDRPEKRNALDRGMMRVLDLAITEIAQQELPVVFRSRSPGMFVAGADLSHLRERTLADSLGRTAWRLFSRIAELAQPTIAAVDGPALGGGCELALACDFRITTPRSRWGLPEVRLGLVPSAGGLTRLRALVGGAWATDLILTGRVIDGTEAHRIGLATRLVPEDALSDAVADLVGTLEANGRLAVQLAKEALRGRDHDRLVDALAQAALIGTEDTQTRIDGFLRAGR